LLCQRSYAISNLLFRFVIAKYGSAFPAAAKAMLLKAVHLCCFLLAMPFKFFLLVGRKTDR